MSSKGDENMLPLTALVTLLGTAAIMTLVVWGIALRAEWQAYQDQGMKVHHRSSAFSAEDAPQRAGDE